MRRILALTAAAAALLAVGYAAGQEKAAPPTVHRVVTAIDKDGKAVALFDGAVPLETMRSPNGAGDIWVTQAYPADFNWLARPPLSRILSDSTLTAPMLVVSLHRGEMHVHSQQKLTTLQAYLGHRSIQSTVRHTELV